MLGVKITVARAGNPHVDRLWKYPLENITTAAGMVIGGDHNDAVPMVFGDQRGEGYGFFAGVVGVLWKSDDVFAGYATLDKVVLHQLGDTRVGAQAASASHDHRCKFLTKQLG